VKSNQSGVKLSLIVISVVVLGVSAWFNQGNTHDKSVYLYEDSSIFATA
jgi:hypothetical protein